MGQFLNQKPLAGMNELAAVLLSVMKQCECGLLATKLARATEGMRGSIHLLILNPIYVAGIFT